MEEIKFLIMSWLKKDPIRFEAQGCELNFWFARMFVKCGDIHYF
jgi:hypothetical protein